MDTALPDRWEDALRAAALLAVDPDGLRGIVLRARVGPVRDAWWRLYEALLPDDPAPLRLPGGVTAGDLRDDTDLAATLAAGRQVVREGILTRAARRRLVVPMAERLERAIAAELGQRLDGEAAPAVIAWDEAAEAGEGCAPALADRLALSVDLDGLSRRDAAEDWAVTPKDIADARRHLPNVAVPEQVLADLTALTLSLGVSSLRAPLFALRAAQASAALVGAEEVEADDIALALRLVLLPRATRLPAPEAEAETEEAPIPPEEQTAKPSRDRTATEPAEALSPDAVLEAARAILPPDVLARLLSDPTTRRGGAGTGAGDERINLVRGRPAGTIRGRLDRSARIDIIGTLRAAVPWQGVRTPAGNQRVAILPQDIRLKRFREPRQSALIFIVDASGSAARGRLAETKGAIELMLGEAYARREDVALIAFRGADADLLLPPTRSLVQARRRLSALPGGGGTPLAAGLRSGAALAEQVRRGGTTPYLVLLTDGRGNVGLDGQPGRAAAAEDARRMARLIAGDGLASLLIDTANRPQKAAEDLAGHLGGQYVALPRANAAEMSALVRTARDAA
ncbi:MAG: magnesium chelatase subunit D [Pseudomonadota bacterium]